MSTTNFKFSVLGCKKFQMFDLCDTFFETIGDQYE